VAFIALIYFVAACNVHTIKSRWTRAVSTIYLIAVGCAAFLYSPWMIISDGDQAPYIAYKWIWNVHAYLFTPNGLLAQTWDYPLVGQELLGLTAITGVVLLIGSLVSGRRVKTTKPVRVKPVRVAYCALEAGRYPPGSSDGVAWYELWQVNRYGRSRLLNGHLLDFECTAEELANGKLVESEGWGALVDIFGDATIDDEVRRYRQRRKEERRRKEHTTCKGCRYVQVNGVRACADPFRAGKASAEGIVRYCYEKRSWREKMVDLVHKHKGQGKL